MQMGRYTRARISFFERRMPSENLGERSSMARTFLGNAFSLQMLDTTSSAMVQVTPVSADEVAATDFVSVVGHPDTANVLADMLQKDVAFNRTSVRLEKGDVLYVAQVTGGRLPEGATTLPDGFALAFLRVELR